LRNQPIIDRERKRMKAKFGRLAAKLAIAGAAVTLAAVHVTGVPARAPAPTAVLEPIRVAAKTTEKAAPPPPFKATAQPAPAFAVKRILNIPGPFRHGDYAWDDKGVPPGPIVITIDLKAQTLSVFRGGYEIGAAVILYGATDKPTPLGTFPITQKDADHHSSTYDAPMPYMLRLTPDGVSIHGSNVVLDAGTHGCIGVPTPFAKLLFAQAKLGDPVIITDGRMMDVSGAAVAG
jgi:lipoprotein-anchoring transpeptidase ErfK/SrfK